MGDRKFDIDADIARAHGPPAALYHDPAWFDVQREMVFPRTWHFAAKAEGLEAAGRVRPFVLLEGCLDEPLLLVRDSKGELICISNVCTHRGNLVVEGEWTLDTLRCRYHGRRFHLDGTFAFMPGFDQCDHFPSNSDYLQRVAAAAWRGLVFASLRPSVQPNDIVVSLERRLAHVEITDWRSDPAATHVSEIAANWVLVMENLLDGFHVPFMHVWRRQEGDVDRVRTETHEHGSLRIEEAAPGQQALRLPEGHPDHRRRIAAYHFALFPTTLVSVYPWGMWLSVVTPLDVARTRLTSHAFVAESANAPGRSLGREAFESIFRERAEDASVIEVQQRGIRSRLYRGGRYSPVSERAVHHFHRLLASWMSGGKGV